LPILASAISNTRTVRRVSSKSRAFFAREIAPDLFVAQVEPARQCTQRELRAARLARRLPVLVAQEIPVELERHADACVTAFWNAALRLAYCPAL
jgi:hypothetical protein